MRATNSEPYQPGERTTFRVRFDDDVDAYDRLRPVAPDVVFDEVVSLCGLRPRSSVLEVGPGTGQATRPLAEREQRILALEIGSQLATRARHNLARFPAVTVLATSFEAWDPGGAVFDAVFACNSFHWIDPEVRLTKSAAVLRPRGHLAVLSTPVVIPDDAEAFWWDIQDDWAAVGGGRVDPASKHPDLVPDLRAELCAGGLFTEPAVVRHRFDVRRTAQEHTTNLSTQTAVKALPVESRAELLTRVENRIEAAGGMVTVHHLAVLTVATRAE